MKYLFVDTETTGLDFNKVDVIELAAGFPEDEIDSILIKPTTPIPEEVVKLTSITNEMVADSPKLLDAVERILEILHVDDEDICYVAHNATYDRKVLLNNFLRIGFEEDDLPFLKEERWLCTLKLARHFFKVPEAKNLKLFYLREFLDLPVDEKSSDHRAAADVKTCALFFQYLKDTTDMPTDHTEMVGACWIPNIVDRFPFGKHKGKKLSQIPMGYYVWLVENLDSFNPKHHNYDKDLNMSVEVEMKRRGI